MPFAEDKLYNGYIRRNLAKLVTTVKVREIVLHLPCLTKHDRETIEAKRLNSSEQDGVDELVNCLIRRENWADQLIRALEACEHKSLATEMRTEYEKLKPRPTKPGAPKENVPPKSEAGHSPVSESGDNGRSAFAPSGPTIVPSQAWEKPSFQTDPPRAAATPSQVPEMMDAPPEPPHTETRQGKPSPATVEEIRQEPEENSFIQTGPSLDNYVESYRPSRPEEDEVVAPTKVPVTPPRSQNLVFGSSPLVNSNVPQEVSFQVVTPERPPVQDTTPTCEVARTPALTPVLTPARTPARTPAGPPAHTPDQSPQPPTNQVKGSSSNGASVTGHPPAAHVRVDDSMCFSKPDPLVSVLPSQAADTLSNYDYSLQISDAVEPTGTSGPASVGEFLLRVSEEPPPPPNMAGQSLYQPQQRSKTVDVISNNPPEETLPVSNRKYFLVGAGVAMCALIVAWRFRLK